MLDLLLLDPVLIPVALPPPSSIVTIVTRSEGISTTRYAVTTSSEPQPERGELTGNSRTGGGIDLSGGGTLEGTEYADNLTATAGGTVMLGGGGNDTLQGLVDGAVFDLSYVGGTGDDLLVGSYGRDSYLYEPGDGHDRIIDNVRVMGSDVAAFFAAHPGTDTYQDRLVFGVGIAVSDVQAERVDDHLVLHVKGDEGSVSVEGWYDGTMFNKVESVVFADGTTWLASDIDRMLGQASVGMVVSTSGPVYGSQYDDVLTATGSARLQGDLGNDRLAAAVDGAVFGVGFEGGRGNDSIQGSYAGDIYYFSRGDGQDTVRDDVRALGPEVASYFAANLDAPTYQDRIEFGAGIGVADLRFASVGNDLLVRIAGTDDSIRFLG